MRTNTGSKFFTVNMVFLIFGPTLTMRKSLGFTKDCAKLMLPLKQICGSMSATLKPQIFLRILGFLMFYFLKIYFYQHESACLWKTWVFMSFLIGKSLNCSVISDCFWNLIDWNSVGEMVFDSNCEFHWVWIPNTFSGKIVSAVYNHINQDRHSDFVHWDGWSKLWKLPIAPRVKTFLWKWTLFYGRIPTFEFLFNLNISHIRWCVLTAVWKKRL